MDTAKTPIDVSPNTPAIARVHRPVHRVARLHSKWAPLPCYDSRRLSLRPRFMTPCPITHREELNDRIAWIKTVLTEGLPTSVSPTVRLVARVHGGSIPASSVDKLMDHPDMPRRVGVFTIEVSVHTSTVCRLIRISHRFGLTVPYIEGEDKRWVRPAYAAVTSILRQRRVRRWPLRNAVAVIIVALVAAFLIIIEPARIPSHAGAHLSSTDKILNIATYCALGLVALIAWSLPYALVVRPVRWSNKLPHIGVGIGLVVLIVVLFFVNRSNNPQGAVWLNDIAIGATIAAGLVPFYLGSTGR